MVGARSLRADPNMEGKVATSVWHEQATHAAPARQLDLRVHLAKQEMRAWIWRSCSARRNNSCGGSTLAHISDSLLEWAKDNLYDDELIGALIVEKALSAPLKRIASNAGKNGAVVLEHVKEKEFEIGYNAATDEYVDMYEAGIIDPAKVTRSTLQNAASIASMVLTTECIIVDKIDKTGE